MAKAKEKMVVFRCKYCIDDLKEYNPYINKNGESIKLENVICIEVPDEECENTTFELTPILLDKDAYRNLPDREVEILLNLAIKKAKEEGFDIVVSIWEDQYARDEGLNVNIPLDEYAEDYIKECQEDGEEVNLASHLMYGLDSSHNKRGCAEIIAKKGVDEFCFYHEEYRDTYVWYRLFEFLYGPIKTRTTTIVVNKPIESTVLDEIESIVASCRNGDIDLEELYNKIIALKKNNTRLTISTRRKVKMKNLKSTGMVRRVDDLGRILIPKEVRRTLEIKDGDPLEVFVGENKTIVFRKYEPLVEVLKKEADTLIAAFAKAFDARVIVTDDTGYVLSSSERSFIGKMASPEKIKAYRDGETDFLNDVCVNGEPIFVSGCHRIAKSEVGFSTRCEGVVLMVGNGEASDSAAKALALTLSEKIANHIWQL